MKNVCLVIGAGAGIGGTTAKIFAENKYHVHLLRRTDEKGLNRMVENIQANGGSASGNLMNVANENILEEIIEKTEKEIGPISVAVYNLGAQIGNKKLEEVTIKQFELGWKMATFGLFRLSKVLFPYMVDRKKGTLIVTSSTAAVSCDGGAGW